MTLVAFTINSAGVPFLTSDLLFSSKEGKETMQLPTNNFDVNPHLPENLNYKPDSLEQKIYTITKDICLGLAGNAKEMKDFLIAFKTHCKYTELKGVGISKEDIEQFLSEYDFKENFNQSYFGIIIIEHTVDGLLHAGLYNNKANWEYAKNDTLGDIVTCGSGANSYLNIINSPAKFTSNFEEGSFHNSFQKNVILIAKLLAKEKITLHHLKENWGGGFEMIYYDRENGFTKVDDIAYVINHAQFNDEGEIHFPIPRLILYYKYHKDILFIIAIEILKCQIEDLGDTIKVSSVVGDYAVNLFVVPALDRESMTDEEMLPSFSFNVNKIAMGYGIISKVNKIFDPAFLNESKDLNVSYKHEESIEIVIGKVINDTIRNIAKKEFPIYNE